VVKYFGVVFVKIRILVVEDDEHIRNMVKTYLQRAGYLVDTCHNSDKALELFYEKAYQLIILDIMLPGMSGHELLKEFRSGHDIPVLMMTALQDRDNELRAFTNNADDYVIKPFSYEILVKRAEVLLRRSGALKKEVHAGKLTLYPDIYKAEYDGKAIVLTPKEFDLLFFFWQNKGKIISSENILTKVWGYDFDGMDGAIRITIKRLRDKFPVNIIKTVKGVGYYLEESGDEA